MASGGKRSGAGRPIGVKTAMAIRRREVAETALAQGLAPLEYMLAVMRDAQQPPERRDDMAKAAAPYVHPRLTSAEVKGEMIHRFVARVPEKARNSIEWQQSYSPEEPKLIQ